jgi:hypothetical protein
VPLVPVASELNQICKLFLYESLAIILVLFTDPETYIQYFTIVLNKMYFSYTLCVIQLVFLNSRKNVNYEALSLRSKYSFKHSV